MAKYITKTSLDEAHKIVKLYVDRQDNAIIGREGDGQDALSLNGLKALINAKTSGIATDKSLKALVETVQGSDGNGGLKAQVAALEGLHAKEGEAFKSVADEVEAGVANKVDKVDGKGLSTNDFDDAAKTKLAGVEEGAQVNAIDSVVKDADSSYIGVATADKVVTVSFSKGEGDDALQTKADIDAIVGKAAEGENAATGLRKEIADANDGLKTKVEALEGKHAEGKTVAEEVAEGITALTADVTTVSEHVVTLIGNDANKSVRAIAADELAAQLIPKTAKDSLVTLAEIAAWIQEHPEDASAMNEKIAALESTVGKEASGDTAASGLVAKVAALETKVGDNSVAEAIEALKKEDSAVEGQYVSSVSEANGVISVARVDLPVKQVKNADNDAHVVVSTEGGVVTVSTKDIADSSDFATVSGHVETLMGEADGSVRKTVSDAIKALAVADAAVEGQYVSAVSVGEDGKISVSREALPEVPEALKNPNALTIGSGDDKLTYDGSAAVAFEPESDEDVKTAINAIFFPA